jgi:hypothetical protein
MKVGAGSADRQLGDAADEAMARGLDVVGLHRFQGLNTQSSHHIAIDVTWDLQLNPDVSLPCGAVVAHSARSMLYSLWC